MAEREASPLYTAEMLALAVVLADYPPLNRPTTSGEAVSRTCGSTIALDLALSSGGAIDTVGLRVSACAVGQAAAAIFARGAPGKSSAEIERAECEVSDWLGGGSLPDWPGIEAIAAAQSRPGRHGAILLPWRAARAALSKETQSG